METSALSFARPVLLNALWLLPVVVALYWWAEKQRRLLIAKIVAPKLREHLVGNASPARRIFRQACILLTFALLIVTLAGPRLGYDTLEVPHRGRDVIIAMDVSRSMLAPDVAPTRLQRSKMLAEDIIGDLGSDRVGLVAFAGSAFLQAPLTLDYSAVLTALNELDTTVIPKGGTNIAAAIKAAEEAFGKAEGFSRALIIISDGEELDADGVAAAKRAGENGIRIFTVGVGSTEGSEIPLGNGDFVRDLSGNVVQTKLDAARMTEIAEVTGGFYTPLNDAAAHHLIADGINKLAESDITMNSSRRPIERYQWPLGAALILLVLQALVGERRRRPLGTAAAALIACVLIFPTQSHAEPAGLTAYEKGDFDAARKAFEKRLTMEPSSAELQLNVGAAAFQLKDFSKAAESFSKATLAEDPQLRSKAEFNLANTLFQQGAGQSDKEKTKTDWKDAIAKYDAALKTRPDFTEAKENKEHVEKLLEELEKEQEKQEQEKQDQKQDQQQNKDQQKQEQKDQNKDQQQNKDQKNEDQQKQDQQDKQDQNQEQKDQQDKGQQDQKDKGQQSQEKNDEGKGDKDDKKNEGNAGKQDKQDEQKKDDKGKEDEKKNEQGDKNKEDKPAEEGEKQPEKEGESGQPNESQQQQKQAGEKPEPVPEQGGEKKEGELRGATPEQEGGEQQNAEAAAAAEEEKDGQMSAAQARALLRAMQNDEEQVSLQERKNYQDTSRDW